MWPTIIQHLALGRSVGKPSFRSELLLEDAIASLEEGCRATPRV
jgi:hypothetical protein